MYILFHKGATVGAAIRYAWSVVMETPMKTAKENRCALDVRQQCIL
jgi:hypothetical protein